MIGPFFKVAVLNSRYTGKAYSRNPCDHRIIKKGSHFCKKNGLKRTMFNASESGHPTYEKLRFQPATDNIKLFYNTLDI
jgi:hypothetical protein